MFDRKTGIGGSDAAAVLGLSPWKSAMDVWMQKKGVAPPDTSDPHREFLLELGQQLEPVIARLYERETGEHLQLPFPVRMRHPVHTSLIASPDRIIEGRSKGVELKSENQFQDKFGEPGTDEVPYHYLIQCAHYMAVMDFPEWDIAVLHGGARFATYTIKRDRELEDEMIHQLTAWWDRYIVGDKPPDVDGSSAWKVYLRQKFPANLAPMKSADKIESAFISQYAYVRGLADAHDSTLSKLENRIKLSIGDAEGIENEAARITWRKAKDGTKVDWESAYKDLRRHMRDVLGRIDVLPINLEEFERVANTVLDVHTQTTPGSRRFLFKVKTYGDKAGSNEIAGPAPVAALGDGGDGISGPS